MRSRAELVVLELLLGMGFEVRYEERLFAPRNAADHRLPDFTVIYDEVTFYWEHLGMSIARTMRAVGDASANGMNATGSSLGS